MSCSLPVILSLARDQKNHRFIIRFFSFLCTVPLHNNKCIIMYCVLNYKPIRKLRHNLKHKLKHTFLFWFFAIFSHTFAIKPKTKTQTNALYLLPFCLVLSISRPASDRPAVASPRPPQGGGKDDDVDVDGVSQIYFEENNLTI